MNRSVIAATIATSLFGTLAHAAEWRSSDATSRTGAIVDVAADYLRAPELQLATVDLRVREVLSLGTFRTVHYVQEHMGLPVLNSAAAVRVGAAGYIRVGVLEVARNLTVSTSPSLSAQDAIDAVSNQQGVVVSAAHTDLAVLAAGAGRLVWRVDVHSANGGQRFLVDAHDGALLRKRDLGVHADGRVYPISSANTPDTEDLELLDLVASTPQYLNGWAGNLTVTNYVSGGGMAEIVVEQTVEPNSGEDFLYDPPASATDATDAFAQVGLYYHLTRGRDFFTTTLGIDMSAASWKLTAAANVQDNGMPLNNAYFSPMGIGGNFASPNLIALGQGQLDFADDSDVFLHEMGHYVTANAVGYNLGQGHATSYGISPWSGSIDEGVSDYFACTINGDNILGEASLALLGGARDLTDTSKVCPDDIFGEVHLDGEIIGSVSWSMREELGVAASDQLIWGSIALLTPGATFGDFGRAVMQTASDLETLGTLDSGQVTRVEEIIAERGLDECDPELPLRIDEARSTQLFGIDIIANLIDVDCASAKAFGAELSSLFHFQVTPDATDVNVQFNVELTAESAGDLDWEIYVRRDEHVSFEQGMFLPTVGEFDYASEAFTTANGTITIDASSDPPFDPSATYHAVIVHRNCPNTEAVITTTTTDSTGEGGSDAGGADGSGGAGGNGDVIVDDGCGCRLVAPEEDDTPLLPWAMLLGLAAIRRRRRG